ncbi:MAG: hypothetical protein J0H78_15785 [Rhizobiales bacterium]|nr:hypothetical protein [Hyphomicrobiales bacterium]OJY42302.1 MAG: hypothetical protein BGP08_15255 [Rhizobiales bacterium 64-17]
MTERPPSARFAATAAVLLLLGAAVSGCSSVGGMFGSSSSSTSGSSDLLPAATGAQASATPAAPAEFDCPSVEIRAGASTLTINAAGKPTEGGALDLRYQGSIVRTARECQLVAGNVNLRVGIEGRIVLGPAGGPGNVEVPIRLAVVEEGANPKTIATKLYRTAVAIPPDQSNSNFYYVAEDLAFPMPRGGDIDKYVIYLGFDPQAEPARPQRRPARRAR